MRLSAAELKEAEHCWIRSFQESSFFKEIEFLLSRDRSSTPSYVTQFGLFLDEGVIKCKGRLDNSTLPELELLELEESRSTASEARIYSLVDQAVTRVCQAQW